MKNVVVWLDNCAAQNKNWTLLSFLVFLINSGETDILTITFRYFEPGHTFMAADSFHHQVELSLKRTKKVYDFSDFVKSVQESNSGKVVVKEMKQADFYQWEDNSSASKLTRKKPRPYLKDMVEIVAERGKFELAYKTSFSQEPQPLNFLKVKSMKKLPKPPVIPNVRGITSERKNKIIEKLVPLMPQSRHKFWQDLPVNENAVDLRVNYDE